MLENKGYTSEASIELKKAHPFVHRSVLGNIALGTLLVGTIGGLGGTIALIITSGSPSRDIVLTTVTAFIAAMLVASRVRWLQPIAILVTGYLLCLDATEPFLIERLAAPKSSFGAFIGMLFILANVIVAFAATVGTTLQDYNIGKPTTLRWFISLLYGVLGLLIGGTLIGAIAQPSSAATTTLTYTNGVPTIHLSAGGFDVSSVTIAKGSKLLLIDDTASQHVLANGTWQKNAPRQQQEPGAPLVNNLSLSGNNATIGPFATAGTYHIMCLIHSGMNLTITVQ